MRYPIAKWGRARDSLGKGALDGRRFWNTRVSGLRFFFGGFWGLGFWGLGGFRVKAV